MEEIRETSYDWTTRDSRGYFSTNMKSEIRRMMNYASARPEEVTIFKLPEMNGGYLVALVPRTWFSVKPPDEAGCHVNTIYRLIRGQGVDIRIAQEACDILGVPFGEGAESTKPVHQLAGKTINHHHRLISSILNQAVFWQVIPDNPSRRVKPPKVERKEAKHLDEEQTATLLHLLDNESYQNQVMIRLFLLSGVRR